MFKPMEKLVSLTDAHLDYLAEQLKIERLVGISSDFPRMNREDKTEMKEKMDKYFSAKKVSRMDFFGTMTVDNEYISFLKKIENPDYHASIHVTDFDNDNAQLRKIYSASGKWFGLEYYTRTAFVAGDLDNAKDAEAYFLTNLNQPVEVRELSVDLSQPMKFADLNQVASVMFVIDQYKKEGDLYNREQEMFVKLKDNTWANVESVGDDNIKIVPSDISQVDLELGV